MLKSDELSTWVDGEINPSVWGDDKRYAEANFFLKVNPADRE